MNRSLETSIVLAALAHKKQVDKSGEHYILHPLRVMLKFTDVTDRIVAVLHDVVEDTHITLDNLRGHGYPQDIIEAVDALTKRPGESYRQLLERAKANPIARRVKVADIEDNLGRMTPALEALGLATKYGDALAYLRLEALPDTAAGSALGNASVLPQ